MKIACEAYDLFMTVLLQSDCFHITEQELISMVNSP